MTITVGGTTITFNDGTTQSTAFTGSSVPAANAVGALQLMLITKSSANGNVFILGDTISGSYVFYVSSGYQPVSPYSPINSSGQSFNLVNRTTAFTFAGGGGATYTPTSGTWRVMSAGGSAAYFGCDSYASCILVQRIA